MNAHRVVVERGLGRPIASSLHAGWISGGPVGAGFGAPPAAGGGTSVCRARGASRPRAGSALWASWPARPAPAIAGREVARA